MPLSGGCAEPTMPPVGDPLYVFHGTLRVGEPTSEVKPATVCNLLPTGPGWRFHLC